MVSLPATTMRKRNAMTSSSREPLAVELGLDQRAGQVVGRLAAPLDRPSPGSRRRATATPRHRPAGTSWTPSSRCTTMSAWRRTSARSSSGTPIISEMTSIGSLPAKSVIQSNSARRVHLQALGEVAVGQLLDPRQQVVDAARGEAARDEGPQPVLAGRVHAEDRHHLVGVGSPGRLLDGDAPRVGVGALGARTPRRCRRAGSAPRGPASGCGAAARARAARRTSGRGRPGTCSRRDRGRPVRWS